MTTEHHTFCRICVAGCGVVVTTDGDDVVGIRGDRDHPLSHGYTCPKGRALPAVHHRADRFTGPLARDGDALVPTTWEASLDGIAGSVKRLLDEHGPRSIGYFVGSGGYFDAAGLFTSNALVRTLGTPSYYSDTTIDVISTMVVSELITGMPGLLAKPDFERAQVVIVVGSNPVVSHGQTVIMPNAVVELRELAGRGALYVLDPRRTETAQLATTHLQGRPGTDHAVFGFLVRELLRDGTNDTYLSERADGVDELRRAVEPLDLETASRRTEIPAPQLQALLESIREAGRVAVMTGTGLSMAPDANVANWFIWALEVVTRSADQPGGVGFTPGFFTQWDRNELPAFPPTGTRAPGPESRPELSSWLGEYPCVAMADEIESGHLRALFVAGGNPAANIPNPGRLRRALESLELLVVADVVPTETTAIATHVWPTSGQLERADLTLIHDTLMPKVMCQHTAAVVPRFGDRQPMWWAYAELGRRLGIDVLGGIDPATATDDDVLALTLAAARCDLDRLREAGRCGQPVVTDDIVFGWVHERVLGERRWQLAPAPLVAQLASLAPPGSLVLVPQRQLRHQNTQHRALGDRPYVQLHPDDAAAARVENGTDVVVTSAAGRVTATASVTDAIVRGAISIPHGWDAPNVNDLTSDVDVDPLTGMPRLSGTTVTVQPASGAPDRGTSPNLATGR
jgi:anaerobic selenocysteine-containing dehydrogenase